MRATTVPGFVRMLLIQEAGDADDPQAILEGAERACEKLRVHLSKRVGQEGFRVLLARALLLTAAEYPHLTTVRISATGSLEGLSDLSGTDYLSRQAAMTSEEQQAVSPETAREQTLEQAAEGAIALVTQFIGLLVTFIGDVLTFRLLNKIWPTFGEEFADDAAGNMDSMQGHEKAAL